MTARKSAFGATSPSPRVPAKDRNPPTPAAPGRCRERQLWGQERPIVARPGQGNVIRRAIGLLLGRAATCRMANVADHENIYVDPVENEIAVRANDLEKDAGRAGLRADAREREDLRDGCLDRSANSGSRTGIVAGDVSENIVSLGKSRGRIQHFHALCRPSVRSISSLEANRPNRSSSALRASAWRSSSSRL